MTGVAVYDGQFGVAQRRGRSTRKARVELRNAGQDAHDLRLQRVGGRRVYLWPVTQAGGAVDREYKLLPGTYRLSCSVASHAALGMVATLRVR
jgi:hypothetical protein